MKPTAPSADFVRALQSVIKGEVRTDRLSRVIYATDASHYQQEPCGVVVPREVADIVKTVDICREYGVPIIARGGGTSLAGQCVGSGLVLDCSKYLYRVEKFDPDECWAVCQPGVVQDQLNNLAAPHGLKFAPDTSTSNRATLAGMVGNNSAGSHSILYGTTGDHLLRTEVVLADGSVTTFAPLTPEQWRAKERLDSLEGQIYREVRAVLEEFGEEIRARTPPTARHNCGYGLHRLLAQSCRNLSTLLCGAEGTLALVTQVQVPLVPQPTQAGLLVLHAATVQDALRMTAIAVQHKPAAVELIDKQILDLTRQNLAQRKNRFFLQGDPGAILAVEFYDNTRAQIEERMDALLSEVQKAGFDVAAPRLWGAQMARVWELRKAGLGIIMGMGGDATPIGFVEDTAVPVAVLPDYIAEFEDLLARYQVSCVYYAHASVGLLHMRPVLNLKTREGLELMKTILEETTALVAKYNGTLSGEHGDGRVRSPYLRKLLGDKMITAFERIKRAFDPEGLFNPGKIVNPAPMDADLRYGPDYPQVTIDTVLHFPHGYLKAAELCNGAALCRKDAQAGGTMCPSYHATREETHTTRARANALRSLIVADGPETAFASQELAEVLAYCLSCKSCKAECPANVDIAKLKAEFLQQRFQQLGTPLVNRLFGNFGQLYSWAACWPALARWLLRSRVFKFIAAKILGVDPRRQIPVPAPRSLRRQLSRRSLVPSAQDTTGQACPQVALFVDVFTDLLEPHIGLAAVQVLLAAGYQVILTQARDSGRTLISQGLLLAAQQRIARQIAELAELSKCQVPIVGLEPSEVLTMRDEWLDLFPHDARVKQIAQNVFLIDEFLACESHRPRELNFQQCAQEILVHGHCHQKALLDTECTCKMLSLVPGYQVREIPSGCCGMAGAFGYQHYELSMQIGEQVLFPTIRAHPQARLAVAGVSCRQQIKDGTGVQAYHPVELLAQVLVTDTAQS